MSDCNHRFDMDELWPDAEEGYPPIYHANAGERRGLPEILEARLHCTECGEKVAVQYHMGSE